MVTGDPMVNGLFVEMVRRRGGDIAGSQNMEANHARAPMFNMTHVKIQDSMWNRLNIDVVLSALDQTWMTTWFVGGARFL